LRISGELLLRVYRPHRESLVSGWSVWRPLVSTRLPSTCRRPISVHVWAWSRSVRMRLSTWSAHRRPHLYRWWNANCFRPHRSTTHVDAACCYRPSSVVCRSICLSQ